MKYRIIELDYEEPDIVHEVFDAKSDKEAIEHFGRFKQRYAENEYHSEPPEFELLRITQVEKSKRIATS